MPTMTTSPTNSTTTTKGATKAKMEVAMDNVLTLDRPAVFPSGKDRPILFSALAWADILLTLDWGDFGGLMDKPFYGLLVLKPGMFMERERAAGRLI